MEGQITAGPRSLREIGKVKLQNKKILAIKLCFFLQKSGIILVFTENYFRTSRETAVFIVLDCPKSLEGSIEEEKGDQDNFVR